MPATELRVREFVVGLWKRFRSRAQGIGVHAFRPRVWHQNQARAVQKWAAQSQGMHLEVIYCAGASCAHALQRVR